MRINLELGFKTWTYLLVLSVKFFYVSYIISFMKIAGPLQTVNKCKAEKKFFMKDADVMWLCGPSVMQVGIPEADFDRRASGCGRSC